MTTHPIVHLAHPDDADALAAMSRDLIERGLPWTWRATRIRQAIRDPETNVAVVKVEGRVLAFGIMEYLETDAYLALLAVREASQRKGLASALLRWLEASAQVAGCTRVRVEARRDNTAARSFYNERGYQEVAITQGRYSDGVDGVKLEKWLRAAQGG